jgi:hypothetical protein
MEEFTREQMLQFRRLASDGIRSSHGGCNVHAGCLYELLSGFPNNRKVAGRSKAAKKIEDRARQIQRYLLLDD